MPFDNLLITLPFAQLRDKKTLNGDFNAPTPGKSLRLRSAQQFKFCKKIAVLRKKKFSYKTSNFKIEI